ncbi:MAG: hypothetical protein KJ630_10915 [Proteobacteria bacterium]|nr:hypothetical protein [Pseudomonadota bacterium]
MIRHLHTIPYFSLIFLFIFLCSSSSATDKDTPSLSDQTGGKSVWTWADKSGSEHAIFISRQAGETWEKPQKISTNEGVNIVPAVTNPTADDLMVVWSNFTGTQAQLRYRLLKNGLWTEEKEYYTGLSSNMAPSVCVDGKGKVWLVWAGFNGISDEIYYTTWNGTSFATATAITANDIPDIQPVLGIDSPTGAPWVQWLQFSESGYVKYESVWNGSTWTEPVLVPSVEEITTPEEQTTDTKRTLMVKKGGTGTSSGQKEAATNTEEQLEIEIPTFITSPESASIHIPGYAVQSLSVRSIIPIK